MSKTIIGKLEGKKKRIMICTLMWFNWSVVTINTTLQLLDIYRLYLFESDLLWTCDGRQSLIQNWL